MSILGDMGVAVVEHAPATLLLVGGPTPALNDDAEEAAEAALAAVDSRRRTCRLGGDLR